MTALGRALLVVAAVWLWGTLTLLHGAQFTSSPLRARPADTLFDGWWSSCPESGGEWTERSMRYRDPHVRFGPVLWTLHLGPRDEFALFVGDADAGEHRDHGSPTNKLSGYHFGALKVITRNWTVPELHLYVSVHRMTGSRDTEAECENYVVRVQRHS